MKIIVKDIPVQILQVPDDAVLVLRVPNEWCEEQRFGLRHAVNAAFLRVGRDPVVVTIDSNIELAVVTK